MKYYIDCTVTECEKVIGGLNRLHDEQQLDDFCGWVEVDPAAMSNGWVESHLKALYWAAAAEDGEDTPECRPHEGDAITREYCMIAYLPADNPADDGPDYDEEGQTWGYSCRETDLWEERFGDDDIVIAENGGKISFSAAVNLMDDDIREALHAELAPCSDQVFFDAYCEAHAKKYGEPFAVS